MTVLDIPKTFSFHTFYIKKNKIIITIKFTRILRGIIMLGILMVSLTAVPTRKTNVNTGLTSV